MADPTPYSPGYDYSAWQASNPIKPLPGDQIDDEFARVAQALNATIAAVKNVRRSDGALEDQIVTLASLHPEVQTFLQTERTDRIAAVEAERGERVAGDEFLADNIRLETDNRMEVDEGIIDRLAAEETNRAADVQSVRNQLTGYVADLVVEKRNARKPLVEWVGTGAYDLDWGVRIGGVQRYAPRNGVDDDSEVLNAILAQETAVVITPGIVNVKSAGLVAERSSTRIAALGGLQSVVIQRSLDLPAGQNTLRLGSPTDANKGARGASLVDLWFTHPGRLAASYSSLANRLTNDESHVSAYGGQKDYHAIGGYGAVHIITFFGGLWHPTIATLQESRSQIRSRYHPIWGHGTNLHIQKPEMYGSNQPGAFTRTIGLKDHTQASGVRCGPQYGLLIESCEDWSIEGGFMAAYGHSNIGLVPSSTTDLNFNGKIRGTYIDESHEYGVYALNNHGVNQSVSQLTLDDVTFIGQLVGRSAMFARGDGAGGFSIRRLKMNNVRGNAYLGGAFRLNGVDGGEIRGLRAHGYNIANNDTMAGGSLNETSGLLLAHLTRNVTTEDCRYGGGANFDLEANNCQWGFADTTTGQGNTYFRQRALNLGKAGGGLIFGGTQDA